MKFNSLGVNNDNHTDDINWMEIVGPHPLDSGLTGIEPEKAICKASKHFYPLYDLSGP